MNKSLFAGLSLLVLLAACKNEIETPNGLKYRILKAGNGQTARHGEFIVFDWQLKDSNDSIWQQTAEQGIPAAAQIADSSQLDMEDGLTQMLRMLSVGDSVRTDMSLREYYNLGGRGVPPGMDTTLTLTFFVKVQNVLQEEAFQAFMEDAFTKREARVHEKEAKEIGDYLASKNLEAAVDTSGLQYTIHNNAGGRKPSLDDCVEVKYTASFLKTGEVFQVADRIAFPLDGVIPGWKIAVPLLGKGDSGTFYIPSKLAYGPRGYPPTIPPDAVLVFNVTLLEVANEFDNTTNKCK